MNKFGGSPILNSSKRIHQKNCIKNSSRTRWVMPKRIKSKGDLSL